MKVELLTHSTLAEWGDPIPDWMPVTGIALRDGADLSAVMAVYHVTEEDAARMDSDDPVAERFRAAPGWWAGMDSRGRVSPLAHKYALKIKQNMRMAGVSCVYADADPEIERSGEWLARIGFVPYLGDIWRCDLVLGDECSRKPDAGRAGERDWQATQECGV